MPTNRSETTSGTIVIRIALTHSWPTGWKASATRSAIGLPELPIALPMMNPATRPMTTRRTRIGRRNYRFFVGFVRASGFFARACAGATFFAGFLAETFTGWARLAVTRTLVADAFLAGTALSLVASGLAFGCTTFTAAAFTGTAFLAGAGATATGFGAAGLAAAPGALGLLFGRPPLRANCASANILANASFASAISCAWEIRRS